MSQITLNEKNLCDLGPQELSRILLSFVSNHPLEKRRLRYRLIHHKNPYALAPELKKRLLSLAKSKKTMTDKSTKLFIEEFSMHFTTIQLLTPLDPGQTIEIMFDLLKANIHLYLVALDGPKSTKKTNNLLQSNCLDYSKYLADLILKHPPAPETLAQYFCSLPLHGYPILIALRKVFEILGPKGQKILTEQVQNSCKDYRVKLKEISPYTEDWYQKSEQIRFKLDQLDEYLSIIPLLQGDAHAFIKNTLDKKAHKDPDALAMLARNIVNMGLYNEALICLDTVSPKPTEAHYRWYKIYHKALILLKKDQQAREFRWVYLKESKCSPSLQLFLYQWKSLNNKNNPKALLPEYEQEIVQLKEFILGEVPMEPLLHAFERSHYKGLVDKGLVEIIDAYIIQKGAHKIKECPGDIIYYNRVIQYGLLSSYSPVSALLLGRQIIEFLHKNKRQKKRLETFFSFADFLSWMKELDRKVARDETTAHIPSYLLLAHNKFMEHIKKSKKPTVRNLTSRRPRL